MVILEEPFEPVTDLATRQVILPGDYVVYQLAGPRHLKGWAAKNPTQTVKWTGEIGLRFEGPQMLFVPDYEGEGYPQVYTNIRGKVLQRAPSSKKPPPHLIDKDGFITENLFLAQIPMNKMAERVAARHMEALAHGPKAGDGSSAGIFLPLPKHLAKQFPSLAPNDSSPSHVTFLYLGEVKGAKKQAKLVRVLREALQKVHWKNVSARLEGLDTFEHPDQDVHHVKVDFNHDLAGLQRKLVAELKENGFECDLKFPKYSPHVTLAYVPSDTPYEGPVPQGEWEVTEMEVWGLPKVHRLALGTPFRVANTWLWRKNLI